MKLKCEAEHYICKSCLQSKTKEEGWQEMYACQTCPPTVQKDEPPIHVFVDHANVWIGAKTVGANRQEAKGAGKGGSVQVPPWKIIAYVSITSNFELSLPQKTDRN